ncbi:MAG: hypothetical protein ACYDAC_11490 [Candidatus Dormibacteria bacterium]
MASVTTAASLIGAAAWLVSSGPTTAAAAAAPSGSLQPYTSSVVASVVPSNGDTNPYSIAVVPLTLGSLTAGNLLVVNFNDKNGTAGAGTSVVQVNPASGAVTTFASGLPISGPVGVAINPVNDGVWIGDFGSSDGSTSNDLLISNTGSVLANFNPTSVNANAGYSGPKPGFNGVWGQGVSKIPGQVSFYFGTTGSGSSGVGGGQVWRIDPHPQGSSNGQPVNSTYAEVASGLGDNSTTAAVPVTAANAAGPQGFAYDPTSGTMYVTNDADNSITAIPGAATATSPVVTRQIPVAAGVLNIPENISIVPGSGDLLVANAGNNTLVAINPSTGAVDGSRVLDSGTPGALFGLAVTTGAYGHPQIYYVDDNSNTLNVLTFTPPAFNPGAVGAPSVTVLPDNSQQLVFWRGSNGDLFEAWYASGAWNGPVDVTATYFGGADTLTSPPSVTVDPVSNQQLVFWQGSGGHLFEAWWAGHWNGPVDVTANYFGGTATLTSAPSVAIDSGRHQQLVFWRDGGGHLFEAWWAGHWNGPVDVTANYFGGSAVLSSSPSIAFDAATSQATGQQLVFWQGPSGHLMEAWYDTGWHGPVDVTASYFSGSSPLSSSPGAAVTANGSQQLVFWQGPSGHLEEAWYDTGWHGPVDVTASYFGGAGPLTSAPAVAVTPDGAQQLVFWQGASQSLWEAWYTSHWNGPANYG